ncbi:MAG: helicase-related protein, partial [Hydrogenobacter sp.]
VVMFSEYVDTAEYLAQKLQEMGFRVIEAVGNLSKSRLEEIIQNFDAQHEDKKDDYDVLVSTDKLSEGINLNRAGVVINYDIPWNPVRVIQRVGRINRIGQKVYEELYIVNFFPTEKGADQTRIVEIAKNKMFMIHKVLGEDAKIFTPDEEPTPSELYTRLSTYREDQEKSFYTIMLEEWERIKKETPDIEEKIKDMPNRVKCAKPSDKSELFVFVKRYGELFCIHCDYQKDQTQEVPLEEAFSRIKADPQTKSLSLSERFWEFYKKAEDYTKERRRDYYTVETSAINNLKSFVGQIEDEFIDVLISAIKDYGVLPLKTLRDITNIKNKEEMEKYLATIKKRFGTALQKLQQDQQL